MLSRTALTSARPLPAGCQTVSSGFSSEPSAPSAAGVSMDLGTERRVVTFFVASATFSVMSSRASLTFSVSSSAAAVTLSAALRVASRLFATVTPATSPTVSAASPTFTLRSSRASWARVRSVSVPVRPESVAGSQGSAHGSSVDRVRVQAATAAPIPAMTAKNQKALRPVCFFFSVTAASAAAAAAATAAGAVAALSAAFSTAAPARSAASLIAATRRGSRSSTSLSWAVSMAGAAISAAFSTRGAAAFTLSLYSCSIRGTSHSMAASTRGIDHSLAWPAASAACSLNRSVSTGSSVGRRMLKVMSTPVLWCCCPEVPLCHHERERAGSRRTSRVRGQPAGRPRVGLMPSSTTSSTTSSAQPSADATAATVVEMWTDGACKGNPGVGGWGVWMRSGTHERELFGGEEDTTNNRMELTAVIEGLRALKRPCTVTLNIDSQYVMKGMTSWLAGWKRNGWRTADKKPVKNAELWQALDAEVARHTISWQWVKGHAGDVGNERADDLANRGVDQVRERRG